MDEELKDLEQRIANPEERESLVEGAKAIIGSCRRIILVRTLKEKARQKALGIDNDNAPEIKALRSSMEMYHKDLDAIQTLFDAKAFKRVFTEHKQFADKFEREVLEHGLKNQQIKNSRKDFPNLNGGPS